MSIREPMDEYLSPAQARRFYDRLGSVQDWQGFYENPAINELIAHAAFDSAHSIFEFGAGLIYVLVFGTCRRWAEFILSPVDSALGVGFLGLEFSKGFPVTVTLAHAAFGGALGWLAARWLGFETSPLWDVIEACLVGTHHKRDSAQHAL